MLSEEQLQMRRTGITATDISAIVGENPWHRPIDVWRDKCEPAEALSPPSPEAMMGSLVEAAVAQRYLMEDAPNRSGWRLYEPNETWRCREPDAQWALATPDRFVIVGPPVAMDPRRAALSGAASHLLECKLVGSRVARHWNLDEDDDADDCDRVPTYVFCQVQWQMLVTGYKRADVAALVYGTRFRSFRIDYDEEYAGLLRDAAYKFWRDHVVTQIPPAADGSEGYLKYLRKLYPSTDREMAIAPAEAEQIAIDYVRASREEQRAKRQKELAAQRLKEIVRSAEGIEGPWGKVTWRCHRGRPDWEVLVQRIQQTYGVKLDAETIESHRKVTRALRVKLVNASNDDE
jgi:putative phage-type endonuclease